MSIAEYLKEAANFIYKFHKVNKSQGARIILKPDNKGGVIIFDENDDIHYFEIIDQEFEEKMPDLTTSDRRLVIRLELKDSVKG